MDSDKTKFADPERLPAEALHSQIELLQRNVVIRDAFDSVNTMILVLNQYRQVVFLNKAFTSYLDSFKAVELLGRRPGELVQCIHAFEFDGGCGTSEACRYCNVVGLLLNTMKNGAVASGESTIRFKTREGEEGTLNLTQKVSPMQIEGEVFYVVSLVDISDRKARYMLERVFFHDLLNTSGALKGLVGMIKEEAPQNLRKELEFVEDTFDGLLNTIFTQRQIVEAENNELQFSINTISAIPFLHNIARLYENHEVTKNKTILVDSSSADVDFESDFKLVTRVLENMLKNALEASGNEGTVLIGCRPKENGEQVEFWIHNDGSISKETQYAIFQRSFTTKGEGRGLGTYSMKLFGEKLLKGEVSFETNELNGTTFFFKLPCKWQV